MNVKGIPAGVDQMLVLGNDNDYLVVYTYLSNDTAIELLERALEVLRHEQQLELETLTKH
jgi:hypothetical protein